MVISPTSIRDSLERRAAAAVVSMIPKKTIQQLIAMTPTQTSSMPILRSFSVTKSGLRRPATLTKKILFHAPLRRKTIF